MFRVANGVFWCGLMFGVVIPRKNKTFKCGRTNKGRCRLFTADIGFLVTQKSENTLGSNDGCRDVLMMFSDLLK